MIRAHEEPRMTAAGLAFLGIANAMPAVTKALRHDVHRAMRTDARQHANAILLATHDDQGLAEHVDVQEVARRRNLRHMRERQPVIAEDVIHLPVEELLTGVGLRRKRGRLCERQLSDALDLGLDLFNAPLRKRTAHTRARGKLSEGRRLRTGGADIRFGEDFHG